ncbi:MAG: hypothetical protein ACE5R4_18200 [Armatimonadota bacterium]
MELQTRRRSQMRERALAHISENTDKMEAAVRERLREVGATARTRKAIEVAHRRYVRGRDFLLRPKFTPEQQRFMRLMIADRLMSYPQLHERLREVVNQLGDNYPREWCECPFTKPARDEARLMILQSAESSFGATPMAGPLAFVRYHHQMFRIDDVSDYGLLYARAARLVSDNYFLDRGAAARLALGIVIERE